MLPADLGFSNADKKGYRNTVKIDLDGEKLLNQLQCIKNHR